VYVSGYLLRTLRLLQLHEDACPAAYGLFFSVPFGARQPELTFVSDEQYTHA